MYKDSLKILSIGNSFAVDTAKHLPRIALSLGVKNIHVVTLYIGGCSVNRHYSNALENKRAYIARYYAPEADEWRKTVDCISIEEAIKRKTTGKQSLK